MHIHIYIYMHPCIYACTCACIHTYIYMLLGGLFLTEGKIYVAWGAIFDGRKDSGVVCVFSIFNAGGSVSVCECVYTHTHTAQVLGCEPRSRDETPGGPEESRWTKS